MKTNKSSGISEKVIRLLEIYTMIAQKKFPSVPQLKEHFRISERSVYRYLEIINMIDTIEYDREREGYGFTNGDRIKKLSLTDSELLVLFAAGEAISHLGGALGQGFQGLMEKVAPMQKRTGDVHKIPIVVKIPQAPDNEKIKTYFENISQCLNERRAIEMVYRAQHTKEITNRIVDPYGLVFYEGMWTVIGYCHLRKHIRTFSFDRILELKQRNLYFKPREDFNLEEYLSKSWGIVEDEEVRVRLRFSSNVADYALRKKWHVSEELKILNDGEVEMTFTVAGVDEIKRWIYSWLPNVEVLEPLWLRERVQKELAESLELHR